MTRPKLWIEADDGKTRLNLAALIGRRITAVRIVARNYDGKPYVRIEFGRVAIEAAAGEVFDHIGNFVEWSHILEENIP